MSVSKYDPSDFEDDILLVQVRGLGRGKGVEIVEKYSLLDGDNPELLDLISDRVAVLYDLLYEDVDDDVVDVDEYADESVVEDEFEEDGIEIDFEEDEEKE